MGRIVTGIVGEYVLPRLQEATRSIDVVSPYISPDYARLLVSKAKSGVRVRVMTSASNQEVLSVFESASQRTVGASAWEGLWSGLGTGEMVFVLFLGLFLVFALVSALQGNFADARLGAVGFVLFLVIFLVGRRTRSEQEEPERSVPLSVRAVEGKLVHAKLYIVDEEVALVGSANLTYSGMNRNIERLELKTSTSEIGQEIEAFLDLWGSADKVD
jgi:phosphatidylserine/phosphatidylglycerophosphate/cardiolipin synthase-like enzyme